MKYFAAISISCFLAALVLSTDGAFIVTTPAALLTSKTPIGAVLARETLKGDAALITGTSRDAASHTLGANGLVKLRETLSRRATKSGTTKLCCYIGDLEILFPVVMNGTESLKRKAVDMMIESAERCKAERDIAGSNDQSSTSHQSSTRANKLFELAEEILEDDDSIKTNSENISKSDRITKYSCNVVDFMTLFPTLVNGTQDEKAVVLDAMMISIKRCNAEIRTSGKLYQYCDSDNKERWGLFFQWMFSRFMNRMFSGMERIIDGLSRGRIR